MKYLQARDVIMTADAMEVTADDEDDVEKYLERMRETDSLKASAHRTPKYPAPISPGILVSRKFVFFLHFCDISSRKIIFLQP